MLSYTLPIVNWRPVDTESIATVVLLTKSFVEARSETVTEIYVPDRELAPSAAIVP